VGEPTEYRGYGGGGGGDSVEQEWVPWSSVVLNVKSRLGSGIPMLQVHEDDEDAQVGACRGTGTQRPTRTACDGSSTFD